MSLMLDLVCKNVQKIEVCLWFWKRLLLDHDLLGVPCPCCKAASILPTSIRPHGEDRTEELYEQESQESQEIILLCEHNCTS